MNNFIKMASMFITELAVKGATEDELWEAIQFSSEIIDLSKKHRIGDMTNKYNIEDIMTVSMLRDLKIKEHKIKTPDEIYEQMKVTPSVSPEDEFYRQTDKTVTALGTYKDPNLTWTAEELGIKKIEKETKQNDDT